MRYRAGFSLVELSIVLVILGLLVGGILSSQSLIRAAQLRSVTTDFQRYVSATNAFRDKYFAFPGDMTNATSFWGAADPTPATCVTTTTGGKETCNGNGDRHINVSAGSNEYFRYWQHLANAGLIEGSYSGIADPTMTQNYATAVGLNSPKGKLSNSGFGMTGMYGVNVGDAWTIAGDYGLMAMVFGGQVNDNLPALNILKPEELWNIDTKFDDGKPGLGTVLARNYVGCTNALAADTVAVKAASDYLLTATSNACAAYLVIK